MRKYFSAIAVVSCIALTGCATNGVFGHLLSGQPVAASVAPKDMKSATQALIISHLAYNGLSDTIQKNSQPGGLIHGNLAGKIQTYYNIAGNALDLADKAKGVADANGIFAQISAAEDAMASAKTLIGK